MKFIKLIFNLFIVVSIICSCTSSKIQKTKSTKESPVVIANDSLEYEIIILDLGFNTYLQSIARPRGYYSQDYLENRNRIFVTNWNIRVRNPFRFNPDIYQNIIDYRSTINYGYEVNYLLFNYFLFAQQKYEMKLGSITNRIR